MSVAAVMLVKDEADVVGHTIDHLSTQVDGIIVADNLSTDGTYDIVLERALDFPRLRLQTDEETGYFQSRKTTGLAMEALELGYQWVVPCDADEVWYAPDGRTISEYLDGVPPDVQVVSAELYNHLPTSEDEPAYCEACDAGTEIAADGTATCFSCSGEVEPNPLKRIGWRQRQRAPLGKVACRLRPDLVIDAGNHSARTSGTALVAPGLVIRHFSWRSPEQYVRKIRNGARAYGATDLPADAGAHWRMWEGRTDEEIRDHFRAWFFSKRPREDASLIFDPAPIA